MMAKKKKGWEADITYKMSINVSLFLTAFHMSLTYMSIGRLPLIIVPIAFLFYLNIIDGLIREDSLFDSMLLFEKLWGPFDKVTQSAK
ncbi:MAG: hypothetical protein KKE96_07970 [Candidatus Altiarchaeota archaeon]|nr:hypothetical protein [Candidatus Altiarchaeota archaeon]MBU4267146.1 hypothetical protein [Candidatus Altiarchaeota archaeon]MBU4341949.1 hypothetical protein [Candidatus Altiarchaeota archaeon]MBU4406385.1 hypothetical protein [Candidatus Altiarchaeota archaeon]MBU4436763.1 hypothetical protein [Candidatus Altiarchaeota archaeon]